jgi:hypothetical protein
LLFETVPTRVVEAHELADVDSTFQTLCNLNTPEDYESALHEVDEHRGMLIEFLHFLYSANVGLFVNLGPFHDGHDFSP